MSVYGRIFAALYDPFLWWGERRGMTERRRRLLAGARGRVLEIGAGTGLNVPHYRQADVELVLAEPDEALLGRLERRLRAAAIRGRIVKTPAEEMPFESGAFDTVISTLVLCTVADPARSLREIRRALAPGGQLLFIEHVRGDEGSGLARWQDRLQRPWQAFGYGCHCNRNTVELLHRGGFTISALDRSEWRGMPWIVRPLIVGRAVPAEVSKTPVT